jgi:hypothetical protein
LLLVATLAGRLGLRLSGRVGGTLPGRKVFTLGSRLDGGGPHISHADALRSGTTERVLGHTVMAPSMLGTFLRSFTFGHIRQLDKVLAEATSRAWSLGAGPGSELVMDADSTICMRHEVTRFECVR